MNVKLIKDIDETKFEYSKPRINTFGGQSVFITCDENKLRLQTPKCYVPQGVSIFTSQFGEEKLSMSLNLNGSTESMSLFTSFLERFDCQNIKKATTNSLVWFKKHLNTEIVKSLYKNQIDNNVMKVKLLMKKGEFDGDVFDKNNKKVSINHIKPGCKVRIIAECIGMYFVPNEFGISWKAIQVKIEEDAQCISGYSFLDDEEDNDVFDDAEPIV
jgi:hypothetical protein